jgi:IS605 OrfB family transposase
MIRTVKFSLKLATASKLRRVKALEKELRSATNLFIRSLWSDKGGLNKATMDRIICPGISYRHKSNCLKQAIETIVFTKRSAKTLGKSATTPILGGALALSSLVCSVEPGKGAFDFVIKIAGLQKGKPIVIPLKSHARANYWLGKPGAQIKQGCVLGDGWVAVAIEIPDKPTKKTGSNLGVDMGMNKLMALSSGAFLGTDIKTICAKIRRKKPGSRGKARACAERKDYINKTVKQLPWRTIKIIAIEDLTGIKTGKKQGRGKSFRKAMSPWTARQVGARIDQLAQQNRVRVVRVDPRDTSRRCPSCGSVDKANRKAEQFKCLRCNYTADADLVGSLNILARAGGNWREPMVPVSRIS